MNISTMGGSFDDWVAALEARHLANLRVPEVTRALRALSSAYVERRRRTAPHGGGANVRGALDSAGKRAAFALFYAPLHFIAVTEVIRALGTLTRGAGDDSRSRMRHRCRWCRMGARVPVDAGSRRHRSPPVGDRRSTVDLPAARGPRTSSSGRRRALAGPAARRGRRGGLRAERAAGRSPDHGREEASGHGRTRRPCARHRANRARHYTVVG